VPDEQHTPVGRHVRERGERVTRVEPASQRRVYDRQPALGGVPLLGGQLRGLLSTRLGAEQHGVEGSIEPRQGDPRRACLGFAPNGQPALGIRARSVRLGLGVT